MEHSALSHSNEISPKLGNRVAVIGASGYGGLQVIRLLKDHPKFDVSFLGGDRSAGSKWNHLFPFHRIKGDPVVQYPDPDKIAESSDFVILSLPNGIASKLVPELINRNLRVIDLSADYRYRSLLEWSDIYNQESISLKRTDSNLCAEAVYGLPEWNRNKIEKAKLVSSPGCFPTASLLPLLPFLKQGLIETNGIVIDAKTGTSGGGRVAKENLLLSEAGESIVAYGVIGHRHTSEIEQMANEISGCKIQLQFTPHLVPMVRGLLATVYCRLRDPGLTAEDCSTVLKSIYREEPCIEVLPVGTYPATKWVRQTNKALISLQVDSRTGMLILMCAIDNLVKGQAGQAIQSLNIMCGLNQDTSLPLVGFYP